MKQHKIIILLIAASFLFLACSKDRSQDEKITITIDKPDAQKPRPAVPDLEVHQKKPVAEFQRQETGQQPIKSEPLQNVGPTANRADEESGRRVKSNARPMSGIKSLDFTHVAAHLDLMKYSKQQIKDYFLSIRGKRVVWSGKVFKAKISRRGFKIYVENRNAPTRSGYNIVLVKKGPADIGDLARGTNIRFSGTIVDVEPAKAGSGPIIVLSDSSIQN